MVICLIKQDMVLLEQEQRELAPIIFLLKSIQSKNYIYFSELLKEGFKLKNQFKNMK